MAAAGTGVGDARSPFGTSFVNGGRWNEVYGCRSNALEPLESIRQSSGFHAEIASWKSTILDARACPSVIGPRVKSSGPTGWVVVGIRGGWAVAAVSARPAVMSGRVNCPGVIDSAGFG